MSEAIFVTVRTGSSRLPNKALTEVYPSVRAIDFLLDRVRAVGIPIVLCTTDLPEDDVLEATADTHGALCFRGNEQDKLDRWLQATRAYGVDVFVTADGDDLFCDPGLLRAGLDHLRLTGADFIECPTAPCGAFTYGISGSALQRVCEVKKSTDTEMMWTYFKDTGLFDLVTLPIADERLQRPDYRLTLDYPEDLDFFRTVITHFGGRTDTSLLELVSYLDAHPEVRAINEFRQQDFLANQARRTHLEV